MKYYSVIEAFELLQEYKITSHVESVRRWLRNGTIKGIPPQSRKEGWLICEENLYKFIRSRLPEGVIHENDTIFDVKEQIKESIRLEMWWELANKFIFEGFLEPKKKQVQECIEHKGYSKAFERYVWDIISKHKLGYAVPRIPYLLDAFLFDGKRIVMDNNYELFEEKILFALIEYLRKEKKIH